VITATSAFGMGIDKENIRFVIHYHLSNDLSNYLQEIGRAGRDGQQSAAILLYVPGDESIQFNLIDQTIPDSYAIKSYVEQSEVTILNPEQIRLLDFYKSNQLTTVEISRIFDNRRRIRQNNLLSMINYAKSDGQLRHQISDYFGNETDGLSQTDESVGVTDWHPKELHLERKEDGKHQLKVLNWSEQLKKLFNLQ
uniref:helicase-related protein n=1 Tax=Weissella thailandensis TaxID=89061 RepID=UPI0027E5034B